MNIIVSGGGTGGHIYPALTIIQAVKELDGSANFLYVGTNHGLEADIVPREGIRFEAIDLQGLERRFTLENFFRIGKAMLAVLKAIRVVRGFNPDVVVGTGGYVAGPILLAASLMGVPTLIQEQNAFAGITNKILAHFATKIAVGMEAAGDIFPADKTVYTGNPIRPEVITADRALGAERFGFAPEKKIVLVSGGSRGARTINLTMIDVLKVAACDNSVQYLHVTGTGEYDEVIRRLNEEGIDLSRMKHIRVEPYLYDMPSAIAMADVTVFRAGATGLAELAARGIPAILIPYPFAAENHQEKNARAVEARGGAEVILNKELTADNLSQCLTDILSDEEKRLRMASAMRSLGKPQAAIAIAEMILAMGKDKKR